MHNIKILRLPSVHLTATGYVASLIQSRNLIIIVFTSSPWIFNSGNFLISDATIHL